MEFGKLQGIFRSYRGSHRNGLKDRDVPIQQPPPFYLLFQQQMFRHILRQCLPGLIIYQHQLGRVFMYGEFFQFNGKRKLRQLAILIRGTPFSLAQLGNHSQSLHICIAQRCRQEGDKQADMIQQKRNLTQF